MLPSHLRFLFFLLEVPLHPRAPGDAAVLQAQQAFAARKLANLERAARDVPADHVLAPYVEYWRLVLTSRTDDVRVADFLARYPGSRMAEALRADWLKSLGRGGVATLSG
jgi:soluble lytic murein transglycosylase